MSDEPSLLDEFELRGRWWLPEKPDAEFAGTLYYAPEGPIRLELMGALKQLELSTDQPIQFPLPPIRRQIILGRTERGKDCTLYGALEVRNPTSLIPEMLVNSSIFVSNLFVGAHFPNELALKFRKMRLSCTHLEEWLGLDPLGSGFNFLPLPSDLGAPLELRLPYLRRKVFDL